MSLYIHLQTAKAIHTHKMGNEFFAASLRKDEDERVKRKGEMQIKKN
jgi:hypothetical protein